MNEDKKITCGIIMPIGSIEDCSVEHWLDVKAIIESAISGLNYTVDMVSEGNYSNVIINRIVQNIYSNDIVICDVSCRNANVMFELGMRLAFDKPVVIIKDDKTDYSFDTSMIEHLEYPRDLRYNSILEFKEKLLQKVKSTLEKSNEDGYSSFLKNFSIDKIATIEEKDVSILEHISNELKEIKNQLPYLSKDNNNSRNIYDEIKHMNRNAEFGYIDTVSAQSLGLSANELRKKILELEKELPKQEKNKK